MLNSAGNNTCVRPADINGMFCNLAARQEAISVVWSDGDHTLAEYITYKSCATLRFPFTLYTTAMLDWKIYASKN